MVVRMTGIGWRAPGSDPTFTLQRSVPQLAASASSVSGGTSGAVEAIGAVPTLAGGSDGGHAAIHTEATASSHQRARIARRYRRATTAAHIPAFAPGSEPPYARGR